MSGNGAVADAATEQDTGLVAAVREGDDRAFEELYGRYHPRIAAYVRGMVKDHARAEDVTQEVFFSALRRMRQTERPIAFKPWIYEIARNACIDSYRRTSRAEELSYDAEGGLAAADSMRLVSSTPTPDDAIESKQRLDDLCGAFGGLSETHHQILVMRELEGLSYREIGERLGMSRAAVESTLFRARRRLTEEYDELVSGRRCRRVQAIIAAAEEGMLGARDRRKLARHVATCQVCRREALHVGVEVGEPRPLAARIAGALPFPLPFLALRGRDGGAAGASSSSPGLVAHASVTLGGAAEPLAAAWTKGVAAVAVLAVAGAGAGAVSQTVGVPGLDRLPGVGGPKVRDASRAAPAGRARMVAPAPVAEPRADRPDRAAGRAAAPAPRAAAAPAPAPATRSAPSRPATVLPALPTPRVNVPPVGGPPGSGPSGGAGTPGASSGPRVPVPVEPPSSSGPGAGSRPTSGSQEQPPAQPAATVRAVEAATDAQAETADAGGQSGAQAGGAG